MIKRTLHFGNPAYLSIKLDQLVIKRPNSEESVSVPIEDIGIVLLDHQQITLTHEVIRRLQDNKAAIISCNSSHMPQGLLLPIEGNTLQSEVQRHQIKASEPLKKQLWQQTVTAKIHNQKRLLQSLGKEYKQLSVLETRVLSGDPQNIEGQAAVYYWKTLFTGFKRDRYGDPPNGYLNYGYAILRAIVARALLSSGLLPTLGIFHKNKYNTYCLADDIMEPFRPFVDQLVYDLWIERGEENFFLSKETKKKLLSIATMDALYGKKKSPLMVGISRTTISLARCFGNDRRKIIYPKLPV